MEQAELNDVQNISINSNFFRNVTRGDQYKSILQSDFRSSESNKSVGIGIESTTAKIDSDRMITVQYN